jgi:hypothetical protein
MNAVWAHRRIGRSVLARLQEVSIHLHAGRAARSGGGGGVGAERGGARGALGGGVCRSGCGSGGGGSVAGADADERRAVAPGALLALAPLLRAGDIEACGEAAALRGFAALPHQLQTAQPLAASGRRAAAAPAAQRAVQRVLRARDARSAGRAGKHAASGSAQRGAAPAWAP